MTQFIDITQLRHHPNNPRKDIGDVTELAESIKKQGLIQPLLVTPHEDEYYVIAGNRRLEACKLAGVKDVYCELVKYVSDDDVIGLMLTENMLRQNLSSFEESNGFQLMLDMGKTEADISKATGLKSDTVKMRTKLRKLDAEKLQKACNNGATIFELAIVADIEDEKERNKLLAKAGTREFNNAIERYKQEERAKERMIDIECFLIDHDFEHWDSAQYDNGYTKLVIKTENDIIAERGFMVRVRSYSSWGEELPKEEDFDPNTKYYYVKSYGYDIYRDATPEEIADNNAKEARIAADREYNQKVKETVATINERHETLRRNFILEYNDFKKHQKDLKMFVLAAMDYLIQTRGGYGITSTLKDKVDALMDRITPSPDQALLIKAYAALEGARCMEEEWNGNLGRYTIEYHENERLNTLYGLLMNLGYEMSEEEDQVLKGTHEAYERDEVNADDTGAKAPTSDNSDSEDMG